MKSTGNRVLYKKLGFAKTKLKKLHEIYCNVQRKKYQTGIRESEGSTTTQHTITVSSWLQPIVTVQLVVIGGSSMAVRGLNFEPLVLINGFEQKQS